MRAQNEELERRLTRLEALQALQTKPVPSDAVASNALPELTIVKLKPKKDAPPKLNIARDVQEPHPDQLIEILSDKGTDNNEDSTEPSPALLEKQFEAGVAALKAGRVQDGVDDLRAFALDNPKHSRADNALYFAGLGLMGLTQYEEGASSFELLIARYPASDTVVDAMLRLAECRVRLKQQEMARTLYAQVISSYPGTAAATQAEQRLAALQKQ